MKILRDGKKRRLDEYFAVVIVCKSIAIEEVWREENAYIPVAYSSSGKRLCVF